MNYCRLSPRFWCGTTGRQLRGEPDAQVLALYLMSCSSCSLTGVFNLGLPTIAHETGLTEARIRKAFERLRELDFAQYDEEAELVWVVNLAKHQTGPCLAERDNRIPAMVRVLSAHKGHPFVAGFLALYGEGYRLPLSDLEAPSKPLPTPFEPPSEALPIRKDLPDWKLRSGSGSEADQKQTDLGLAPSAVVVSGPYGNKRRTAERLDVSEVLVHYQRLHPRSRPGAKERKLTQDRLREFTVAELIAAIDGYHRSPFHLGQNERGQQYLGLDLIFRDSAHVNKGLDMPTSTGPPAKVNGHHQVSSRPDCDFHRGGRNSGRAAPRHEFKADCPECRHMQARASPRAAGEVTGAGELFAAKGG